MAKLIVSDAIATALEMHRARLRVVEAALVLLEALGEDIPKDWVEKLEAAHAAQ